MRPPGRRPGLPLGLGLAGAFACLNTDFVRAMVLADKPHPPAAQAAWETGVRVACLAQLIAAHTQACDDQQAWLAGVAHNLADYPGHAQAASLEDRLAAADPDGFIADAVRFCRASPARV